MALGELCFPQTIGLIFLLRVRVVTKHWGVHMRKLAPALISYRDDFLISYSVNIFACLNELTRTTHALPVSVHRQTIFMAKSVVISRLHGTVAKFRTEVKFSLRYNDRMNSPR